MQGRWLSIGALPVSGGELADIVQVQAPSNHVTSGACAVTIAAATTNNLLIGAAVADKTVTDWTDPANFTMIREYIGPSVSIWLGYKVSTGGETSVSISSTASVAKYFWVAEYSGLTADPLDVSQVANSNDLDVNSQSTGTTATTNQADEWAIAIDGIDSGQDSGEGLSRTWTNGFAEIAWLYDTAHSSAPGISIATKILSATGAVESTYNQPGTADQQAAAVATFKRASA